MNGSLYGTTYEERAQLAEAKVDLLSEQLAEYKLANSDIHKWRTNYRAELSRLHQQLAAKDTALRKAKDALAEYATDETKYGWTAIAAIVEIDKELGK